MCAKFKPVYIVFLFLAIELNNGMPQGFFSQGFSIPRFVSNFGNVRTESPNKSSLFSVFGRKNKGNTIENSNKIQQTENIDNIGQNTEEINAGQNLLRDVDNGPQNTNLEKVGQSNKDVQVEKLPKDNGLISKFNVIDENYTDIKNDDTEITTELITETTTDDYESTTIEELFNRSSPQLVASLLG